MDESKISVVLVDDQSLIRQGMRYIINSQSDMVVVGEASDVPSAIEVVLRLRPDIVLMDIQMPQQSGIEATASILEQMPRTKVILLTTFDVTDYVFDGIRAGAVGYILKDTDSEELLTNIRLAHRGAAVFRSTTASDALAHIVTRARSGEATMELEVTEPLTEREIEVLQLMAYGKKNSDIAQSLHLSEGTVKTHVHRIIQKLGVDDRTQAVVMAIRYRLVK